MSTPRPKTDPLGVVAFVLSFPGFVVFSIPFAIVSLRRVRRGERGGRGFAVAALAVSGLWLAFLAAGLVLVLTEEPESERFSGERKRVVAVVDEVEEALRDDDLARVCATFTPAWRRAVARRGSCETGLREADVTEGVQVDIEVESVRLLGRDRAVVRADEAGDPVRMRLRKLDGDWKIDQVR